jgi:hypothetical protein
MLQHSSLNLEIWTIYGGWWLLEQLLGTYLREGALVYLLASFQADSSEFSFVIFTCARGSSGFLWGPYLTFTWQRG